MKALTPAQMRFCELYVSSNNATQAYIDAGFKCAKKTTASVESSKLLGKPNITLYVDQLRKKECERNNITTERVIDELVQTAFGSMADVVEIGEDGNPRMRADANLRMIDAIGGSVSSSSSSEGCSDSKSFTVKRADKVKALDMLCKLLGLYEKRDTESGRNLQANADRVLSALRRFKEKQ